MGGYLLRRNLRGRTTQRVKRPAKTAAAAMAGIIMGVLQNRYEAIMDAGCYRVVAGVLNVCYTRKADRAWGKCPIDGERSL